MTTRLEGPLKRELDIGGATFVLTISPEGLRLVPKGKRKGHELSWGAFLSGDAALAQALNASLVQAPKSSADPRGEGPGEPRDGTPHPRRGS